MKAYLFIRCGSLAGESLESRVNAAIENGYEPLGSPVFDSYSKTMCQAMYKKPAKQPTPRKARNEYPDWFEEIWKAYPKRAGSNPKGKAYGAAVQRLKDIRSTAFSESGIQSMGFGVKRYAAYCKATGKLNTEYIMQAATFFGPDKHYENAWAIPKKPGEPDPVDLISPSEELIAEMVDKYGPRCGRWLDRKFISEDAARKHCHVQSMAG